MIILISLGVGFIWGGVVVWLVERRRYEELCEQSLRAAQSGLDLVARLRGDVHALATWLVLARERIKEAWLLMDRGTKEREAWYNRVSETVWEIQPNDIEARSQSDV